MKSASVICLLSAIVLAFAAPIDGATLTMLPDWFGNASIRSLWMMPDGKSFIGVEGSEVFRWSAAAGRTSTGTIPQYFSPFGDHTYPTDVSDDGATIIGAIGTSRE